jgi:hypothetical protein
MRVASVEVLMARAGAGTLADGKDPLVFKEAKPLPSATEPALG